MGYGVVPGDCRSAWASRSSLEKLLDEQSGTEESFTCTGGVPQVPQALEDAIEAGIATLARMLQILDSRRSVRVAGTPREAAAAAATTAPTAVVDTGVGEDPFAVFD